MRVIIIVIIILSLNEIERTPAVSQEILHYITNLIILLYPIFIVISVVVVTSSFGIQCQIFVLCVEKKVSTIKG